MLGVSTGGRISELLSLTIGDVYQNSKAKAELVFDKSIVKWGEVSRRMVMNLDARLAVEQLIAWHKERYKRVAETRPLFPSRKRNARGGLKSRLRIAAHDVLKRAFDAAGLNGNLATHSMRKSFAQCLFEQTTSTWGVKC